MTSKIPSSCCITGSIREGEPTGTENTVHGLDTYIAPGDARKGVIAIVLDVFGWKFVNTRLLADSYAKRTGLTVYLPDFMFEKLVFFAFPKFGIWITRHHEAVSWPIINGFFEALHKENNSKKVFVAGYCWGGLYAIRLLQREKWVLSDGSFREGGLVDAVYAAHPSFLLIPKDIEAISVPISIAVGECDERLPMKRVDQIKSALHKREGQFQSEVVVYKGSRHGFAIRGNIEIQDGKEAMIKSEQQAAN